MTAIDRKNLLPLLGFEKGKVPPDVAKIVSNVPCPDFNGQVVVTANVVVKKKESLGAAHRIVVVCPKCGKEVPFGRYHQHAGTKACKAPEAELPDFSLKRGKKRILAQEPGPARLEGPRAGQGMGASDGHRAGRGRDASNAARKRADRRE